MKAYGSVGQRLWKNESDKGNEKVKERGSFIKSSERMMFNLVKLVSR